MCNAFDLSISSDGWKCDCTNVQGFVGDRCEVDIGKRKRDTNISCDFELKND